MRVHGGGRQRPGALLLSLHGARPDASADLLRLQRLAGALGDALARADDASQAAAAPRSSSCSPGRRWRSRATGVRPEAAAPAGVTRWVVLLRGVNVGGHRRVPMAELRAALGAAGLPGARTYLQSGNAVLDADGDEASVAAQVRAVLAERLGVECDVMVRSVDDLRSVAARNPWPDRVDEPTKLHVVFLAQPPAVPPRTPGLGADEEVHADGREVWVWYGGGAGCSRLAVDAGTPGTARNWRTVSALVALAGE